jgi:hypothetical protein
MFASTIDFHPIELPLFGRFKTESPVALNAKTGQLLLLEHPINRGFMNMQILG